MGYCIVMKWRSDDARKACGRANGIEQDRTVGKVEENCCF